MNARRTRQLRDWRSSAPDGIVGARAVAGGGQLRAATESALSEPSSILSSSSNSSPPDPENRLHSASGWADR